MFGLLIDTDNIFLLFTGYVFPQAFTYGDPFGGGLGWVGFVEGAGGLELGCDCWVDVEWQFYD